MSKTNTAPNLNIDLLSGVIPVSRASSSLAALIKRSQTQRQPIIVTQKGRPTAVILDIELYTVLREMLTQKVAPQPAEQSSESLPTAEEPVVSAPPEERKRRGGRPRRTPPTQEA
jgi:prevent-host-death family protein